MTIGEEAARGTQLAPIGVTLLTVLAADSGYASPVAITFGIVVGAVVGGLIGASKNRTGLGVLLGALLGCIGWIIIALIPRRSAY